MEMKKKTLKRIHPTKLQYLNSYKLVYASKAKYQNSKNNSSTF